MLIGLGFTLIMLIYPMNADCIAPPEQWNRTFGGPGEDYATCVQQTDDGGYILGGVSSLNGYGQSDALLIKTNKDGMKVWNKTFGGNFSDGAYSVQQVDNGGYIVAGFTSSFGVSSDAWLIKTDNDGFEIWNRTFGGDFSDGVFSVQQTDDGGYVLAGYTDPAGLGNPDAWLIKTDANGLETWNKTFGGIGDDRANSVQETKDGGYIIGGEIQSIGSALFLVHDAWLIKTDSTGEELWNKTFGGSNDDLGLSVQETKDGGYILAGNTKSFGAGDRDAWLIKTDFVGSELWNRTFGGSVSDYASSVRETKGGGYIISGITGSFGAGQYDAWLTKTDSEGDKEWSKAFGGLDGDEGNCVQETEDGGYILAGDTYSFGAGYGDFWLIKVCPEEIYPRDLCLGKVCHSVPKEDQRSSEIKKPLIGVQDKKIKLNNHYMAIYYKYKP